MKCLNMKRAEGLLFVLSFVVVYQIDANENKTSQMATLQNVPSNSIDKDCPQLLKIIHDSNLTNYKSSCTPSKISNEVNIENILQIVCSLVSDMLDFICDKKINVTVDLFKDDHDSICPFDFSHLERLGFRPMNLKLLDELQKKDHCLIVCSDLYSKRTQCIMLSKLNNFLKSFAQMITPEGSNASEVSSSSIKIEQINTAPEKISEKATVIQKPESWDNKLNGAALQNSTRLIKDKKNDKNIEITSVKKNEKNIEITSVSEVEQNSNYKTETSKGYAAVEENNDFISENENLNEKKDFNSDNQEDISSLGDPFLDKAEISPDLSKMESSDVKIDSSSKQKEIYSGDGFFSAEDSHFFFYLIMVSSIIVVGYIAFHNKNKILAYALEGTSGRRGRRRPNPARYRKLETNLEEVISSSATNAAASSVVY